MCREKLPQDGGLGEVPWPVGGRTAHAGKLPRLCLAISPCSPSRGERARRPGVGPPLGMRCCPLCCGLPRGPCGKAAEPLAKGSEPQAWWVMFLISWRAGFHHVPLPVTAQ